MIPSPIVVVVASNSKLTLASSGIPSKKAICVMA